MEIAESTNCKNGILLDSLPHGMSEHQWAVDHIKEKYNYDFKVNFILNLEADQKVLYDRVADRLVHIPSGRSYNKISNPPKVEGLDDITGEPLVRRVEDSRESLEKRLEIYKS